MDKIPKLKELLAEMPDDSFLQHALALEYIKAGDDMKAKKLFEAVLEKDPGYTGSYYHLARLLERNHQTDEAIQVYEKGMDVCKKANDRHALNELSMAYDDLVN